MKNIQLNRDIRYTEEVLRSFCRMPALVAGPLQASVEKFAQQPLLDCTVDNAVRLTGVTVRKTRL